MSFASCAAACSAVRRGRLARFAHADAGESAGERSLAFISTLARANLREEDERRARDLASHSLDWSEVLAVSRQLGISPLLSYHIDTELKDVKAPVEVTRELWMDRMRTARRTATLLRAANRAVRPLSLNGIPFAPLKGAAFVGSIYPSPDLRRFSDIDILVPREDYARVGRILGAAGAAPIDQHGGPASARYYRHRGYRMPGPEGALGLEVHRSFAYLGLYPVDPRGIWSRAAPDPGCSLEGGMRLAWEDHLLHLVLHHAWHYYSTDLRTFVDLSEIARIDGLDWDAVVARARARGLRTALFYSLSMTKGFLGAPVPAEVLREVRPGRLRRRWLDRFLETRAPPFYRFPEHPPSKARWFIAMPIVDSPLRRVRFAALFSGLRIADRLAALG